MIKYFSRAELAGMGGEIATERLTRVAKAEARSPINATFLSYSSKDADAVPGVIRILENHGAKVYLDKKDPTLASKRPQEVAETLRSRIKSCKKLVVFATESVKQSKWVPWELGLGDGEKSKNNVCIFPGPDKSEDKAWLEQEYLGVYERIIWANYAGEIDQQWMVWNHETNNGTRLADWLAR